MSTGYLPFGTIEKRLFALYSKGVCNTVMPLPMLITFVEKTDYVRPFLQPWSAFLPNTYCCDIRWLSDSGCALYSAFPKTNFTFNNAFTVRLFKPWFVSLKTTSGECPFYYRSNQIYNIFTDSFLTKPYIGHSDCRIVGLNYLP